MIHHYGYVGSLTQCERHMEVLSTATGRPFLLLDERVVPEFGVRCYAYAHPGDDSGIGLVECVVPFDGPVYQWWAERNHAGGLHHVAHTVRNLEEAATRVSKAYGWSLLRPDHVVGLLGLRVNFVHPKHTGMLIELVEDP